MSSQDQQGEPDGTKVADMDDASTSTKKKRTINRGPKLDTRRLLGPRGLPAVKSYYEDFKFKGKGHELEDLDIIMNKLEHWAHRLYPKFTFDDCMEKIEALGHKKEIQTCLKKIRSGMSILDDDFQTTVITKDGIDLENDNDNENDNEKEAGFSDDESAMYRLESENVERNGSQIDETVPGLDMMPSLSPPITEEGSLL
uniref:TIMELESS-interacting protein n=1 Tax=Ciona savignyi TaxID=51511 RepID=H2ZC08_CIOSA